MSKAVGDPQAMSLTCVFRDRDTVEGGKAGRITTNPADVDAIDKRAWKRIYDGIGGCIEDAVVNFLNKYCTYIAKLPQAELNNHRRAVAGASWPRSATHARIVYLEKLGTEFGQVMSYRPLTIIAPVYRALATMRLNKNGAIG